MPAEINTKRWRKYVLILLTLAGIALVGLIKNFYFFLLQHHII